MKKFEVLEHITDLKIKVFGRNKQELFKNAMLGMFEAARYQPKTESKKSEIEVQIKSFDFNSLLVDFLSEVLYLSETRNQVFQNVVFRTFSDPLINSGQAEIEAVLSGQKLKKTGTQIKGVTYHGLEIKQKNKNKWEAVVLFDI